ncbi:phage tail sheath C-terminal domain-containing protein [Microbacterium sp. SS28]|uniref:phage tail sheath C-terminal domain-containing protein n=1 Tax=Microbacterium sp. SS28 TaxID=2919948 RepID=UPI001FAAACFE|nr:phage tail sheath C-terminal domain-containing protein [Microbacterium sp. SS28]
MPSQLTYPGVYIEEVPSGVRTIVGVSTSVTAFVGRAPRGPVGEPTVVTSYGDYERAFGGLWKGSALGFAVRDFFSNGGSIAVVVRLYRANGVAGKATGAQGGLTLETADEGEFGAKIRFRVDHDTRPPDASLGEVATTLFNLTVYDGGTGLIETHRNVSVGVTGHPRFVTDVLKNASTLVRVSGAAPGTRPAKHAAPTAGQDIWALASLSEPLVGGSDGDPLTDASFNGAGLEAQAKGLFALERADIFNLLVIPPYDSASLTDAKVSDPVHKDAARYAAKRRALYIVDGKPDWTKVSDAITGVASTFTIASEFTKNVALYFPRLMQPNPLKDGQLEPFAAAGAVAGVFARTDAGRGVWKAPAGLDAGLNGVPALEVPLTDGDIGQLNPLGVNALRAISGAGRVIWGARTLQGSDRLASEWKYVPVRRTALYIEESLFRGTQWVVFEPNDEPLWAQIRLSVGTFLGDLFRQGAFQGRTPREAYFVKCDRETTTQSDIDKGIVNIHVGFAPLKPAEFVVIRLQQIAGASAV